MAQLLALNGNILRTDDNKALVVRDIDPWSPGVKYELDSDNQVYGAQYFGIVPPNNCADVGTLVYVYVNDEITEIGEAAFLRCFSLESVRLPQSLQIISHLAFYGCTALQYVTLPTAELTYIQSNAFQLCGLEQIQIPDCVWSIGDHGFDGCEHLHEVSLGRSIRTIDNDVFANCATDYSGMSITLPAQLRIINGGAFANTPIDWIRYRGSESDWSGILIRSGNETLTAAYDNGLIEFNYEGDF